jgi:predicted transcriptional regulator
MIMPRAKPTKPVKTMSVSMAADLYDQIEHLATERRRPKSWQMLEWVHAGMRSEGIQPADLADASAQVQAKP